MINYALPVESFVTLKVYDLLGREVMTLVNGNKSAGNHAVTADFSKLSSGTYIYKLSAGKYSMEQKTSVIEIGEVLIAIAV